MSNAEKMEVRAEFRRMILPREGAGDGGVHGTGPPPDGSVPPVLAAVAPCPTGSSAFGLPPVKMAVAREGGYDADTEAPQMPTRSPPKGGSPHNPRIRDPGALWSAMVARPVPRKEALGTPAAKEALMREWNKLRKQGVWDEKAVKPWAEVKAKARLANKTIHVGRSFDICVEKNHELPPLRSP